MALMSRFSFIFGILALITFARLGHSLPCVRIDDPASAPTSAGVPQPALSSPFPFKASVEKEMSTAWSCPVSETEVGTVAVDVACSVGSTAACRLVRIRCQ